MEDLEKYVGVIVAAVLSAVTWLYTQKGNKDRDIRIATRDALRAQSEHIAVLEAEKLTEQRRRERAEEDLRGVRDENEYLRRRLRHFEDGQGGQ